jgi:ABC-type multidrug transport system fused ATPase/permease subunit
MILFNQLKIPLTLFPTLLSTIIDAKMSIERITKFLLSEEISDYVKKSVEISDCKDVKPIYRVMINKSVFTWSDVGTNLIEQSRKRTKLKIDNFTIKKGELVAVVGPVGSGKSTLVSAILGDMNLINNNNNSKSQVVVNGNVAYVPQSSWIPNDTLQNVVLFGRPMNRSKYVETLKVCNLEKDLELLDSGDMTEIGEKGTNLSGGQKQRLSIARAVYEDADIYIFDDPLSALDAEVSNKLFKDCIKGALSSKTRVLVTHQLSVLSQVDRVIIMQQNNEGECVIIDQGRLSDLLGKGYDLSQIVKDASSKLENNHESKLKNELSLTNSTGFILDSESEEEIIESEIHLSKHNDIDSEKIKTFHNPSIPHDSFSATSDISIQSEKATDKLSTSTQHPEHVAIIPTSSSNVNTLSNITIIPDSKQLKFPKKLITTEEKGEGVVSREVYMTYINAAKSPLLVFTILASFLLSNVCQIAQQWTVGAWTSDFTYSRFSQHAYLIAVASMASGVAFFTWLRSYLGTLFGAYSSQTLHDNMVSSVLRAPLSFFGKLH